MKYENIRNFSQRCEEHPDHQSGMISHQMIQQRLHEEIDELREYIEQAQKQEPDKYAMDIECTSCGTKQSGILTVNTASPQRQWVGLTDEEREMQIHYGSTLEDIALSIEAKLKEKNT